jgi:hypothetical protein
MISSISQGSSINRMSYSKVNANSNAAEEATESVSEKMAESRKQAQYSANSQVSKKAANINPTTGNIIDVHI